MLKLPLFLKKLHKRRNYSPPFRERQVDEVEIEIEGVLIKVSRKLSLDIPHEITAVIPRVEIRRRTYENGEVFTEEEKIFNSITIVHAPRHPLAGETPPKTALKPGQSALKTTPKTKHSYNKTFKLDNATTTSSAKT